MNEIVVKDPNPENVSSLMVVTAEKETLIRYFHNKWCAILVFTIDCEGRPKNLLKEHIDEVSYVWLATPSRGSS